MSSSPSRTVAESLLVEDDGLTFDALDRARLRTTFLVTRDQGEVAIDTQTSGDGYRSTAVRRSGSSFTRRPARRSSAGRSIRPVVIRRTPGVTDA